jgi:hypothetical protein
MKNQAKFNALAFNKNSLVELNDQQLNNVDSGITSSPGCYAAGYVAATISSSFCGAVVLGAAIYGIMQL